MPRRTWIGSVALVVGLTAITFLGPTACGGSDRPPEIVTEPVRHFEVENALAGPDLAPSAIGYLLDRAATLDLRLSGGGDYDVISQTTTPGLRHIRLQQTHLAVPVFGSIMIAHADDTTFVGFNGYVTKNLDGFDVTPALSADEALAIAQGDHAGGAAVDYADETSRLLILPGFDGKGARLAWQVAFYSARSSSTDAGLWNYFVDARDGAVLWKFDNLQTLDQATGPGGNAKVSRMWDAELDVEPDGAEFKMDTEQFQTLDRADMDMVVVGPLDSMPNSAANDAHGHAETVVKMMRNWMGRDSLDDNGFKIISRVNDMDYCSGAPRNACWNGSVMTYGAGGGDMYNRSGALNTVAHELNHGFTEFHSALVYSNESGGLNESFSDVAGTAAEFYDEGDAADFLHSEDSIMGEAMRYICEPTKDGSSIDHMDNYAVGHEVHSSSGVGNKAFCLAVSRYKASDGGSTPTTTAVRAVAHMWYTANAAYWTSGTTYVEACRGTVDAARALGHSSEIAEGVAQSWADVGVECESGTNVCNDDGSCDAAGGETCASCPDDCGSCAQPCSFWKKRKCNIGIGDCSQCGDGSGCGDGICDGDEDDSNCAQDCGCAALACEQLAPFGCWCDDICEEIGDCCADREDAGCM
jgi:Zn-dependent metalloprotease